MGLCVMAVTLGGTLELIWIVIAVLIGIGLLIFVHELGHFVVAKACGVKCEKFYLGFDVPIKIGPIALPRTLGKIKWGETEYGIGIIPLGGYVKMLGQDDNPVNAQKEAERIRIAKSTAADPTSESAGGEPVGTTPAPYELDPRSYPAKSVPQRMAIISAGVIMNLIFAVVFAAIAYRMGVTYEPCEIGATSGGSPAWAGNLPVGSKIIQIDRSGTENDHLRFDWDLMQTIALHGSGGEPTPIDLQLELPSGQREWVSITPSDRLVKRGLAEFASLGVRSTRSTTTADTFPLIPHMAGGKAHPPLAAGDRIVAVNGHRLDAARANELGELPADDVEAALAANLAQPITLTVVRTRKTDASPGDPETLDITLPPQPLRTVGLALRIGPLEAVRQNSPAAQAGLQVGDIIQRVNGQAVGDPVVLPQQFEQWIGQSVKLEVLRPSSQDRSPVEVEVHPESRYQYDLISQPSALMTVESIGIAYSVGNEVLGVEPGSPAEKSGMRPGDVLHSVSFVATTEEAAKTAKELIGRPVEEAIAFDAKQENWTYVSTLLQMAPEGMDLQVSYTRSGQAMEATLRPVSSPEWYYVDRGLQLMRLSRLHTASSWSEAWHLGLRETKESLQKVFNFLAKLVTLRVSPKSLGGPLMIAAVAGSEASEGMARLLLLMTFLSANLAVLNFLPIPALDGGHMVFLAAEAVTGKPVDERLQGTLTLIGVVCLLGLMLLVFYNDIGRLFM